MSLGCKIEDLQLRFIRRQVVMRPDVLEEANARDHAGRDDSGASEGRTITIEGELSDLTDSSRRSESTDSPSTGSGEQ